MSQFGSFDGRDNRQSVYDLLRRLGHGLPEIEQAQRRARFLRKLLGHSQQGFARCPAQLSALSLKDAYFAFTAITGVLGVSIEQAARLLEDEVRHDRRAPIRRA